MSQTTTISSQITSKLKSQTLVKSRANGLLTKYSHILELEPTQYSKSNGSQAMGISKISGLVSGGHKLPKLALELEETDLHVGMMEWLEGIDEKDRKGKEGLELTQITSWLYHVTNNNGKPSQTVFISHLGQGQINFLSNHVAAPTARNVFQPINLTSTFSMPEPSQNNSSINFFDLPNVNLGNFFGDSAPVASGSGAASTSGTSGASVGLEEHGVDVNRDVDDEREDELVSKDAGNGNLMQLDR
ncbi:hypothetical protein L218DRAFT_997718 [Marasmius fiardii PR-910]|nr:hypothetical protein L218DRAFT_997718 [Marasmius fiardii PR-910]